MADNFTLMIKRTFDIIFSFLGLLILSPILLCISLLIAVESKGGVFFKQVRVGKNDKDFKLLKFRTMYIDSDKKGLLTIGDKDPRVTKIGLFLRKNKIDELPQLINIFKGEMSFVGPRPEVRKYVKLYNEEQRKILTAKPGLTDYASIAYIHESELLAQSSDPENCYITTIMPEKLKLNLQYIQNQSFNEDLRLIFKTISLILKH